MREGKNAREVIDGVRTKLAELKRSLPPGVEIVTTYDRSGLIDRAVDNLTSKLVEEFIIVGLVCALFLWHARSALKPSSTFVSSTRSCGRLGPASEVGRAHV